MRRSEKHESMESSAKLLISWVLFRKVESLHAR
jgi:hypothetical protein